MRKVDIFILVVAELRMSIQRVIASIAITLKKTLSVEVVDIGVFGVASIRAITVEAISLT